MNKRHFVVFLDNCSHRSIKKPKKETDSEASVKCNEVKVKPDRINKLILKTKTGLKERPESI